MTRFLLSFLLVFSAVAAYAADPTYIKDGDTCDNTSTGALSGNIQLETVYSPNVISISWQDENGTQLSTSTCTYDTQLQIPNAPSARTGYTFKGWVLDETPDVSYCSSSILSDMTISASDKTNGNGLSFVCLDIDIGNGGCTGKGYDANAATYGLTDAGQWAVVFSYGNAYGESLCSETSGKSQGDTGTPDETGSGTTQYCWCRVTAFMPSGDSQCTVSSPSWVFLDDGGSSSDCADYCAYNCAEIGRAHV